ncbi:hypothetical protein LGH82_22300 [Mesorhizobium sp. PAMC28654]|uniref:hypothetical protein n=1 Tax=Mesorhizobium sp. PAMC28654 TaxID=2880934 RepID=UPI001D0B4C0D|nr:hypothetical protein [Mesorhizobium sp. PAMC28654]UDL87881.1 hypothetical protein LGH82_22300 [Mesorhizobium sp. PAMC28654]
MEADIFFSRLQGGILSLRTFLALSRTQVKPEMGMPATRRKQGMHCLRIGPTIAAQHILPAMQH